MRRKILLALAGLLLLLFVAFLLRQPLLAPTIRSQLIQQLGAALGVRVEVGEISGNLLDRIKIAGIQVHGTEPGASQPGTLLTGLRGGTVTVDFDLLALLSEGAGGLRRVEFHCQELALNPAGHLPKQQDPPDPAGASGALTLAQIHRLVPGGVQVTADKLRLGTGSTATTAPLKLEIAPLAAATTKRAVDLSYGSRSLQLALSAQGAEDLAGSARIQIPDPGKLMQSLGVTTRLQGGTFQAELSVHSRGPSATGQFTLAGATLDGEPVREVRGRVQLDTSNLTLPEIVVDAPGLKLTCDGVRVPLDAAGWPDMARRLAGRLDLELSDPPGLRARVATMSSHTRLPILPPEYLRLLPTRGRLSVSWRDGTLRIGEGHLTGPSLQLRLKEGHLAFGGDATTSTGQVGLELETQPDFAIPLPDGQRLRLTGKLACTLAGSMTEPSLEASVRIQEAELAGFRLRRLLARLQLQRRELAVDIDGAEISSSRIESGNLSCGGSIKARRGEGRVGWNQPSVAVRLGGDVDPRWLALAGAADLAGRLNRVRVELVADAQVDVNDARSVSGTATLKLPAVQLDQNPPWSLAATANRSRDGSLAITDLALTGNGRLNATAGCTSDGAWSGQASLDQLQLSQLTALAGAPDLQGTLTGTLSLQDLTAALFTAATPPKLSIDLRANLQRLPLAPLPQMWRGRLPTAALDVRLAAAVQRDGCRVQDLQVRWGRPDGVPDNNGGKHFRLDARGYVPLTFRKDRGFAAVSAAERAAIPDGDWLRGNAGGRLWDPDLTDQRVTHRVSFHWRPDGPAIPSLELLTTAGSIQASASAQATPDQLLSLQGLRNAPLDITVDLRDSRLERLPSAWLGGIPSRGRVAGRIHVGGTVRRPQAGGNLSVDDGSVHYPQVPPVEGLKLRLTLAPNKIQLTQLQARMAGVPLTLHGHIGVAAESFWLALEQDDAKVTGELQLKDVPLRLLPRRWSGLEKLDGKLSGSASLRGTLRDPDPTLHLTLRDGEAAVGGRPPIQNLALQVELGRQGVHLKACSGVVADVPFRVTADLRSPQVPLWQLPRRRDAEVRGTMQLQDLTLDVIPRRWGGVDDLRGRVHATLALSGSVAEPRPRGTIRVQGVAVKLPGIPRLAKLETRLEITPHTAALSATADMGAAPVQVTAHLDARKQLLWRADGTGVVRASVSGKDLLLMRGRGTRMRANVNLDVNGSPAQMMVTGRVAVTSGKVRRRLSLIPDPRVQGNAAGMNNMGLPPIPSPIGERLKFQVDIVTESSFVVRTHVFDADLDAALKLLGTGTTLRLDGAVSCRSGRLRFPGSTLDIQTCRLLFDSARPGQPELNLNATGRRYGFDTRIQARGRIDNLEVDMTSVPPLATKEVFALITTGVPPDRLANRERNANISLVGTYILTELLGSYFASESTEAGEDFLDRFTFEFGRDVSRKGEETWRVEYDLSHTGLKNLAARVEQDIYEDQSLNLIYRIRF